MERVVGHAAVDVVFYVCFYGWGEKGGSVFSITFCFARVVIFNLGK